jgi:hypothetical protein
MCIEDLTAPTPWGPFFGQSAEWLRSAEISHRETRHGVRLDGLPIAAGALLF